MEIISRISALILIIFFIPVFLTLSILSLFFQGFPVFFKQDRVGKDFEIFQIVKFRTMVLNRGEAITLSNDSRVTKWGLMLRKLKLDELPQLLNIIKGDMRFIGPRPEVLKYFNKNNFNFLKNVKPGISDFSSIILRNENEILESIGGDRPYEKLLPIKIKLANYYSNRKSFSLDFKLVLITIISIFLPDYASRLLINSELRLIVKDLEDIILKR